MSENQQPKKERKRISIRKKNKMGFKEFMQKPATRCSIALGGAFLVFAVLIGAAHHYFAEPFMAENAAAAENSARAEVLPQAAEFEQLGLLSFPGINFRTDGVSITAVHRGFNLREENVGYAIAVTAHEGQGGDIRMMVGIFYHEGVTPLPVVNRVMILSMTETPGLGARVGEDEFLSQFTSLTESVELISAGYPQDNEIMAVSGAVITSQAVTDAVNFVLFAATEIINDDMMTGQEAQDFLDEIIEITDAQLEYMDEYDENGGNEE